MPKAKLAILSYHSWDISPEALIGDISALRANGWTGLSLDDAYRFIAGKEKMTGKYFLVTSDDGSAQDEDFVDAVRQADCPAVLFVNIGTIPGERLPFYRLLTESGNVSVQDHGRLHRKHFVSSQVYDYVTLGSYLGGLEHLGLEPGMPVCFCGGELSAPQFIPEAEAMALAVETARILPPEMLKSERNRSIESALIGKGLGYRRLGSFFLQGTFEREEDFSQRVFNYVSNGKKEFEDKLGRVPKYYAYTWWQGSQVADAALRDLGYKGSFSGTGHLQGQDGRYFGIPRIAVESTTPRPLQLENLSMRQQRERTFIAAIKNQCKSFMGMR